MGKKWTTFKVDGQRKRRPRKTWKEVVVKDMSDLELKLDNAMDHTNRRQR